MKHIQTGKFAGKYFQPLLNTPSVQAAIMTLRPGQVSGELMNEHPKAEQWVYVITGSGAAIGKSSRIALKAGSLLLIPKGEIHQIKSTGSKPLTIMNFYAPPAYDGKGEVRSSVKK